MKRYLNLSLIYAIAAMAGGVFYREFTKYNGFTGVTALGKVHVHLFLLGMFMFLIVALFASRCELTGFKSFRVFLCTYNAGVVGIGHILTGAGIILLLVSLKSCAKSAERAA